MKFIYISIIFLLALSQLTAQTTPRQYYQNRNYPAAIKSAQANLKKTPLTNRKARIDNYIVIGWSYLNQKKYDLAYQYANQADGEFPEDPLISAILGTALYYLNDYQRAKVYLENYIKKRPTGSDVNSIYYLRGLIYESNNELNLAEIAYLAAVNLPNSYNDINWRLTLARLQVKLNKNDEALKNYDILAKIAPNNAAVQRELAALNKTL